MSPRLRFIGKATALLCAVLLTASTVRAQSSALGHAAARTTYVPRLSTLSPVLRIYPDDHIFQATMKIEHYYQAVEKSAAVTAFRTPVRPSSVAEEAAPITVSVTEPAAATETIRIRGPNGDVRAFPIAGGRQAIKARTIIVHRGERLNLTILNGRVEIARK